MRMLTNNKSTEIKPMGDKIAIGNQCEPACDCAVEGEPLDVASAEPDGDAAQACCGPTCDCNAPPQRSRAKIAVAILVLTAAAAILVVKLVGRVEKPGQDNPPPATEKIATSVAPAKMKTVGSFLELNTVAAKMDAVLVMVPARGNVAVGEALSRAVDAARRKLEAKVMSVGVYALSVDSPDFGAVSSRHSLPGVIVFSGGGTEKLVSGDSFDMGMLTGKITESRILQAYVAASLAGSGGGCNCAQGSSCEGD